MKDKLFTKTEYAEYKGVSVQYICKIINSLKVKKIGTVTMIRDCAFNDNKFSNPAWNNKKNLSNKKMSPNK